MFKRVQVDVLHFGKQEAILGNIFTGVEKEEKRNLRKHKKFRVI